MPTTGSYDKDLQMFVEQPTDINPDRLCFFRWLAERGQLEHEVFGAPTGPYTELMQSDRCGDLG